MNRKNSDHRERWARLRFLVVGPLLAAPPPSGALQAALAELASKSWKHPLSGLPVRFGASTIERWFYQARGAEHDPMGSLQRRSRKDAGTPRLLSSALQSALQAQYQAHRSWSYQLHYDNLAVRVSEDPSLAPLPSYPTLRRYMQAHGFVKTPRVRYRPPSFGTQQAQAHLDSHEVRSFEAEYVHALWHLDFHQGSRRILNPKGQWETPRLLGILDDHSRLVCHLQWYWEETAECLVHGLSQAFQKRGLPRALLTDNGSAMVAEETQAGLTRLGILHETTLPYSPYQNAKQEVFWAQIEGRLLAMLEGCGDLSLELLNEATLAWVEQGYHRTEHSELGTTPLARYLAAPNVGRSSPPSEDLRAAFRLQVTRKPRRSDGTVSVAGRRFEIPSAYRHLQTLHLRYARWDLRSLDLCDPIDGQRLCVLTPLDKAANANTPRRRLDPPGESLPPPAGMAPLLRKLMVDYAISGLPPAYLPLHETDKDE